MGVVGFRPKEVGQIVTESRLLGQGKVGKKGQRFSSRKKDGVLLSASELWTREKLKVEARHGHRRCAVGRGSSMKRFGQDTRVQVRGETP